MERHEADAGGAEVNPISPDGLALLRAVNAAPHDDAVRLVAADWFAELNSDLGERIERELRNPPPSGESDGYGGGDGDGGDGGDGGYGGGVSGGYRRFVEKQNRRLVMHAEGSKVLTLIPGSYRNYVYCGIVGECVGAHTYELTDASMVLNSGNGPDWPALARGENRTAARFSKIAGAIHVGPQFGGVFEWHGELP